LDLNSNTALTSLNCRNNDITSLDIYKDTALTYLDCLDNQLSSLDVSQNTALTYLSCGANQLTSLDISNNTALTTLDCIWNQISSLDLSSNTTLTELDCFSNQLTSLDLSNNTALTVLACEENQLDSLNVSNNLALIRLICGYNPLTSLNLCLNQSIEFLNIQEMPTLGSVFVWSSFPSGVVVYSTGSPDADFIDCSTVGIEKYPESGLSIYPIPTHGLLTIESHISGPHAIKIRSLNGQLKYSAIMEGSSHQIDISSFHKGVYFITVSFEDFVTTRKIIKI
jgi:Leucine-rich repeat (LRR) protein